jgi:hypothetical protein
LSFLLNRWNASYSQVLGHRGSGSTFNTGHQNNNNIKTRVNRILFGESKYAKRDS